jgi:glyoxylase-like metal-dependent hydrolase (beta-lactamase superfamily II)
MNERKSLTGLSVVNLRAGVESLEEHIAPLDAAAPHVHGLRTVMVNLYAVSETDGTWVLVDTGLPGSTRKILNWSASHGFISAPAAIILTHGHFDHVGAVDDLSKQWNVPVYAHTLELPYLTGQREYDPPDPSVGGGLMSLLSPFYPKKPINLGDRVQPLPPDGSVPGLTRWSWLHTPGHSPGHVSFFREIDRVLLAGDAVVTTKQESLSAILSQRAELHGPPAYFTNNWAEAEASAIKLAALKPTVIAAGHGKPMVGTAATEALTELAANFKELAIPAHGRYINTGRI